MRDRYLSPEFVKRLNAGLLVQNDIESLLAFRILSVCGTLKAALSLEIAGVSFYNMQRKDDPGVFVRHWMDAVSVLLFSRPFIAFHCD